jgi:glutaredoxin 2
MKDNINDVQMFENVTCEMLETYKRKNADYGNSFSDTIQEFGFIPAVARINDKMQRVKKMVKGEQMNINESMRDNLLDIANYCILTIMEIDKIKPVGAVLERG